MSYVASNDRPQIATSLAGRVVLSPSPFVLLARLACLQTVGLFPTEPTAVPRPLSSATSFSTLLGRLSSNLWASASSNAPA